MVVDRPPAKEDAYSIWLRARSAVTSVSYPSRIDYTIDVTGLDGDTPADDHYRASYDISDAKIALFPISQEQLAKPPPRPHGVNVGVNLFFCWIGCWGIHRQVGRPEPALDLLGEPLLTPTYTFGIRYASDATAAPADVPSLPVIAVVSAQKPEYRVQLAGTATIEGEQTYDLLLTPLRKPGSNRLRELWVGVTDYLPRRASISGNFTSAPMVDVPWTIDFSVSNGAPYIVRESAAGTLYLPHRRVVRLATVAFQDVREGDRSIYGKPIVTPEKSDTTLLEP